MSDELVAFLKARLDEDDKVARDAGVSQWGHGVIEGRGRCVVARSAYDEFVLGLHGLIDAPVVASVAGEDAEQKSIHIASHDPVRALADVEVKRRIADEYEQFLSGRFYSTEREATLRWVVQLLALPYASHPDYRAEWSPSDEG